LHDPVKKDDMKIYHKFLLYQKKALGTPAHIYFKNESVSPIGSHKLNSALAQAYYCKEEGVTNITTETGAGQWGAALSYAAKVFGLEAAVYQVKISYEQKPYRRSIMQTFGAQVTPSPSMSTRAGKDILTKHPTYQGSLGTVILELTTCQFRTRCRFGSNETSLFSFLYRVTHEWERDTSEVGTTSETTDYDIRIFACPCRRSSLSWCRCHRFTVAQG